MTIDERLEFLLKSTESLHANLEQLIEENRRRDEENRRENRRRDERERKLRGAMLSGIAEFLRGLDGDDESPAANGGSD